jgi:NAD-dependent SIR2 family protein deacetylase
MSETTEDLIRRAAESILQADALLIGAGAGMGVDSGMPDFRGPEGFWRAYPPYAKLGLGFTALANPRWFRDDPTLAWGFYGHRLELYRRTPLHEGFQILRRWADRMSRGAFVFTSNVDGHFQRAGFDPARVVEVHGALDGMQCTDDCGAGIFPSDAIAIQIDESTMRAVEPLPACPSCGALARPNVLMFGDWGFDPIRTDAQHRQLELWLRTLGGCRLVVVECGAGMAVPTVRLVCEDQCRQSGGTLIRINPREPGVPPGQIALPLGALDALRAIDDQLANPG